jgi:hypothetical protein
MEHLAWIQRRTTYAKAEVAERRRAVAIEASRTARPTSDVAASRRFYEELVGLPVLFAFEDHDGFDGVILRGTRRPLPA